MDINKYSPKGRMSTKHVFSVSDLEEGDIYEILHLARKLKQKQQVKEKLGVFEGKNVAIMLKSNDGGIEILRPPRVLSFFIESLPEMHGTTNFFV